MIHETALVDEGAQVGEGTRIWHWSHICSGAKIGKNCSLGQNVYVSGKVIIGDNVKIQNNVSVYDQVILEDNVFCGPSMVFTNVYNPRSEFPRKAEYMPTVIRRGATLGANCTIVCGFTIGEHAFVGAGTIIINDVKPFALMVGNPGRQVGWMSRYGEQLELPLTGEYSTICPHTNDVYFLSGNDLVCTEK